MPGHEELTLEEAIASVTAEGPQSEADRASLRAPQAEPSDGSPREKLLDELNRLGFFGAQAADTVTRILRGLGPTSQTALVNELLLPGNLARMLSGQLQARPESRRAAFVSGYDRAILRPLEARERELRALGHQTLAAEYGVTVDRLREMEQELGDEYEGYYQETAARGLEPVDFQDSVGLSVAEFLQLRLPTLLQNARPDYGNDPTFATEITSSTKDHVEIFRMEVQAEAERRVAQDQARKSALASVQERANTFRRAAVSNRLVSNPQLQRQMLELAQGLERRAGDFAEEYARASLVDPLLRADDFLGPLVTRALQMDTLGTALAGVVVPGDEFRTLSGLLSFPTVGERGVEQERALEHRPAEEQAAIERTGLRQLQARIEKATAGMTPAEKEAYIAKGEFPIPQPGEFAPPYQPPPEAAPESTQQFIERTGTLPPGAPGVKHQLSFAQEEEFRRKGVTPPRGVEAAKGAGVTAYQEAQRQALRFGLAPEVVLGLASGPQDGLTPEQILASQLRQSQPFTLGYETPESQAAAIRAALEGVDFARPEGRLRALKDIKIYMPGERLRLEEEARKELARKQAGGV